VSWVGDYLAGIAQHLEDDGVGYWDPTSVYPGNVVGIFMLSMPATPDTAIVLTHYDVDPTLYGHGTQGLQVRCRGTRDPRVVLDIADEVFQSLHAASDLDLAPGVFVTRMWLKSSTPLGTDANARHEISSNYYALTTRPQQNTD
jgi:hypothetical protein